MLLLKTDNIVNVHPSFRALSSSSSSTSLFGNPHEKITSDATAHSCRPCRDNSVRINSRSQWYAGKEWKKAESSKWLLLFSVWPIDSNMKPGLGLIWIQRHLRAKWQKEEGHSWQRKPLLIFSIHHHSHSALVVLFWLIHRDHPFGKIYLLNYIL